RNVLTRPVLLIDYEPADDKLPFDLLTDQLARLNAECAVLLVLTELPKQRCATRALLDLLQHALRDEASREVALAAVARRERVQNVLLLDDAPVLSNSYVVVADPARAARAQRRRSNLVLPLAVLRVF